MADLAEVRILRGDMLIRNLQVVGSSARLSKMFVLCPSLQHVPVLLLDYSKSVVRELAEYTSTVLKTVVECELARVRDCDDGVTDVAEVCILVGREGLRGGGVVS